MATEEEPEAWNVWSGFKRFLELIDLGERQGG
jgi:hypothetical protein